ncbi:hypothetical protein C4561_02065 [candidate division WWE3 bacterium]|uniref:Band 7 domain-containing protein n=1 Tax=candidate division WWE3 bacterium TaxID=2053526 RepID=A0A3A4ZEJ6_UNCKA|nr:MAG: hypothetical protein C4561_02065 [candidate division WWE3 bacterium]
MDRGYSRWATLVVAVLILLVLLAAGTAVFGYMLHGVKDNEIAVKLRRSVITDIVGPGVYNDPSWFADIHDIKIEGVRFYAVDPEVLTKDQQRIGLVVEGDVYRPGLDKVDVIRDGWSLYRTFYTNDKALVGEIGTSERGEKFVQTPGLMQGLAQQAMKVCVGDRTFAESVVGSARDELRGCIDEEISKLAIQYGGIEVRNIIVPNIILSPEVTSLLDQITNSKFQVDLARQDTLKAEENGRRLLAETQAQIRVEQGKIQEEQRQAAITAELERKALEAQKVVIEAEKANELLKAQKDFEIAVAIFEVKKQEALSLIAKDTALAELYSLHPEYLDMLVQEMWSAALAEAGAIYIPAGTDPTTIIQPGTGSTGVNVIVPGESDIP